MYIKLWQDFDLSVELYGKKPDAAWSIKIRIIYELFMNYFTRINTLKCKNLQQDPFI